MPLTERAKEISAFSTPDGLYQYKVMPFGLKGASSSYQRLINKVIHGLEGCESFQDDAILGHDTFEEHLRAMHAFFMVVRVVSLSMIQFRVMIPLNHARFL